MVPSIAYDGLRRFARAQQIAANALLGKAASPSATFGWNLMCRFDRCVRGREVNSEMLQLLEALRTVLESDMKEAFLRCFLRDVRSADTHRQRGGTLRSLWGTTPIINIIASVEADRLLGVQAESVVVTSYHTTSRFDLVLKGPIEELQTRHPQLAGTYRWLALLWALLEFDVFFLFNDQGFLSPVGGYGSERFGINLEEMKLLRAAGKRFYTLTYGADNRTRVRTLASGKFNFCMDCPEVGKFCLCDDKAGEQMFATIGKHATKMLATGLSLDYVPDSRRVDFVVLDTDAIQPVNAVREASQTLCVVHSPNHPFFKGTRYLEEAVARLRAEGCAIELQMLSGVSHDEVVALMRSADVVVDQLIGGNIGLTAMEAMALGKPVVSYVREPARFLADPGSCPVINANPDTIQEVLRALAADASVLPAIGRASRAYVVRHHSIPAFAERLRQLYRETGNFPPEVVRLLDQKAVGSDGMADAIARLLGRAGTSTTELARRAYWSACSVADWLRVWLQRLPGPRRVLRALFRRIAMPVAKAFGGPVLVALSRVATALRTRFGTPRTLWGVTPILTLPRLAACDRLLGLKSQSLVFQVYHTASEFDISLKHLGERAGRWDLYRPFTWLVLAWAMLRFDVFHFFCDRGILLSGNPIGVNPRELALLRAGGKRIYTYTYGADVRTRERTQALGKFNFCMHCPEPGKFCICDDATGASNIRAIELHATRMLAMGDMLTYVPNAENLHFWPLDLGKLAYAEPRPRAGGALRVAHAPNHPHFKGTHYLEQAVVRLQQEGVAIELVRIQGVPNSEVLRLFREVDLVAEQFIGGFHGYTALEAMAVGRPVISFLRSPEMMIDAESCPILNADPDSLYQVLKDCALGRHDLPELGRRGRVYVERYYSLEAVAARLGRLYLRSASLPPRRARKLEERVAALEEGLPVAPAAAAATA